MLYVRLYNLWTLLNLKPIGLLFVYKIILKWSCSLSNPSNRRPRCTRLDISAEHIQAPSWRCRTGRSDCRCPCKIEVHRSRPENKTKSSPSHRNSRCFRANILLCALRLDTRETESYRRTYFVGTRVMCKKLKTDRFDFYYLCAACCPPIVGRTLADHSVRRNSFSLRYQTKLVLKINNTVPGDRRTTWCARWAIPVASRSPKEGTC